MTYPVSPTDPTTPKDTDDAFQGAEELRALKGYLQGLLPISLSSMNFFRKNLLINGDQVFDQRNEGASINLSGSAQYITDKFVGYKCAAATASGARLTASLGGGSTSLLSVHTTVAGAPAAGSIAGIETAVEGLDAAQLMWGTANAVAASLSFLVSSPVAGLHTVTLRNSAKDRCYIASYTVAVADTAQIVTINGIPGDITGTWLTDTGIGIDLFFDLGSGSNFESATVAAWQAGNFTRSAGAVKVQNAVGFFKISNIQLERSAVATFFEVLPIADRFLLCERYYEKSFDIGIAPVTNNADVTGSMYFNTPVAAGGVTFVTAPFEVAKRVAPTVVIYNPFAADNKITNIVTGTSFTPTTAAGHMNRIVVSGTAPAATAVGDQCRYGWSASADFF